MACGAYNEEQSSFFSSFRGVSQDENLPLIIFALFLNYLNKLIGETSCIGVNFGLQYYDITLYLKLLVLLYALFLEQMKRNFNIFLDMFFEFQNNGTN